MEHDAPVPAETAPEAAVEVEGVNRFACAQCGAELAYAPGTTVLRCAYCGVRNEITAPPDAAVEELDYAEHLRRLEEAGEQRDLDVVKCGACGAETERPPSLDAFQCVFCGADILVGSSSARLIKPRALLPFEVSSEQAHRIYRRWIASRWFAPRRLRRFSHAEGVVEGIYLPFWTYDCTALTEYTGQRGEDYWETQRYTTTRSGKRETRTRRVRKTRWYPAAGRVRNTFDDLLVAGTRSLPSKDLVRLEPWDLDRLVPYGDAYMAGFRAERYAIDLPAGFAIARTLTEPAIRATVCDDIGGDRQRVDHLDARYHDVTFKHILLPVWLSAYRFRGRVYRILINARTGELIGQRPYSAVKIALAVVGAAAAIGLIVLAAMALR